MNFALLLTAFVILICVLINKISNRFGIPMLLAFIALGMVFGSDGLLKIPFENYGSPLFLGSGFHCRTNRFVLSLYLEDRAAGKPVDRLYFRLHGCGLRLFDSSF